MAPPTPKPLYGVVHVPPLPGTPFHRSGSFPGIVKDVRAQARRMVEGGMDGLLLQTVDRVYSVRDDSDPARVAAMSVLAHEVLGQSPAGFAVGVQIMRHAVSASLAVAKSPERHSSEPTHWSGGRRSPHTAGSSPTRCRS